MCGIAGAVGALDPEVIAAVHRIDKAQVHRGPDDQGFWASDEDLARGGAVFAFRRLAIIDLTHDSHQPMIDADTGNVIVFNGEIYNFLDLRAELEADGIRFRSSGDTEVLLRAYGHWGIDVVRRLRGMFAFGIWDARERRTVLARDRIGIKPLYLCEVSRGGGRNVTLFASELRALLASGLVPRRLNPTAVSTYAWNGFVFGPETIVEGVRLLPAGTVAVVSSTDSHCAQNRYWRIPDESVDHHGVSHLEQQLVRAGALHMVSDVPLGVFLSGGVDSSAVAALAVRSGASRVKTVNLSFEESDYDEAPYARSVATALGTDHTEIRLSQSSFKRDLASALASLDQPTFDAINTYFVSRAVREAGLTVALAGTGGDELFGGYRSFLDLPRAASISRWLSVLPSAVLRRIASSVARLRLGRFGETPPQTRWGKLGDVFETRGELVAVYQAAYSLFTGELLRELLERDVVGETANGLPRATERELRELIRGNSTLHAISMLELSCFLSERLLRDTDCASMAVSLEVRVPLLDHEVIEAVGRVDESRRFAPLGKKRLLQELAIMKQLDPAMFDRPKAGFVLPIEVWCRSALGEEVGHVLGDAELCGAAGLNHEVVGRLWRAFQAGAPGIYWSRIWALFVLLWWCRRYRVSV